MSTPIPAPRLLTGEAKKPIPTPRRTIKQKPIEPAKPPVEEPTNTFSRRVRSLSNVSKQIAEDIGELVQDKKKAVIAGTRQSVRRITKRFNSSHQDETASEVEPPNSKIDDTIDIFSSISFESPISQSESIYNNVDEDQLSCSSFQSRGQSLYNNISDHASSSDEFISSPPPSHPPPPLPDDTIYDSPASAASGSTSNSEKNAPNYVPENYESVFPAYSYNSDSESCVDMTAGTIDRNVELLRSSSWKFYDSVANRMENIYNDIDGAAMLTPVSASVNNAGDNFDFNSNLSDRSVDVRNSMYENHVIVARTEAEARKRPSESVILQFDPLQHSAALPDNPPPAASNDLRMLEELLQGDLYGNLTSVNTLDDWSISNDSEPDDFLTPPPPPTRFDSLPDEEQSQPSTPKEKSRTSWFTVVDSLKQSSSSESKKIGWLKQIKEVLEKAPDVVKGGRNRDAIVQRPELEVKSFTHKKGMLYKVQSGPVEDLFGEYSGRWCILENSNLTCYSDSTQDAIKEQFPSESILSIQIVKDPKFKYKYDNEDLHCFELNTTGKSRGGHVYGARDNSERRIWMQFIAESLTKKFSTKITTDYTRMGWAYLREGVSGKWVGAWIILSQRTLYYVIDGQPVKSMDLRKVRCLVLQVYQETDNSPRTNDKGPNMVVDSANITLYLRMWTSRETKVWCHIVKLAAHDNGANLDQQQLTKNNIPVLVEKCINFIYAHGSMTEGIYRRPGTSTAVTDILSKFRKDAWAVQLTTDKYSENDVATALKRFFRDLPESLLGSGQRKYFYQVALVKDKDERIRMYKAALDQLPRISFKTAKKLLGHLHFIASQSEKNLMSSDNLASFWGPTIMHYEHNVSGSSHLQDTTVVKQLIELAKDIFPEDPGEIEQEKMMLQVLKRHAASPHVPIDKKTAGDFRVWIYFKNKEGPTFNVAIGANKTAYDVCVELSSKVNVPVHQLILEEVALNNKLTRPIHHTEKILDVVLRWGYWDEADRKDNHLTLTLITEYIDFIEEKQLPVMSGDLKFADSKSRNFKMFFFEFSQAKLTYSKDKSSEAKLFTWNVEDIIWYLGHESKRNPQTRWTVTFIETKTHPVRTRSSPYFGNILVWNSPTSRANWLAAMLKARYQEGLRSPAMHVNLLAN